MLSWSAMAFIDPVAFLRSTPPFDELPEPLFDEAARALEIGLFPKGTWLVRVGGAPLEHLWVIRKGMVRLERGGQPLQVLEEGEIFGYTSLLSGKATIDVHVEEDLLAYRIPAEEFRRLAGGRPLRRALRRRPRRSPAGEPPAGVAGLLPARPLGGGRAR